MSPRDEKADSESAASSDPIETPTHTPGEDMSDSTRLCLPSPGKTYFIRHHESGKFLYVKLGFLMVGELDPQSGRYWTCLQEDGWLGFRETGSGSYIGWNQWHEGFQMSETMGNFVVTPKENKGCYLQAVLWPKLVYVGIRGESLVQEASSDEAVLWRFMEV
ncbi:hypothetical protein RRF57_005562 [Xylaria bambusicola]|uniref:Uncharacterized protein n=1 Tax=Xylaria bambusicola TaxID=326684 RepID=A0AAN7UK18_9PEZI